MVDGCSNVSIHSGVLEFEANTKQIEQFPEIFRSPENVVVSGEVEVRDANGGVHKEPFVDNFEFQTTGIYVYDLIRAERFEVTERGLKERVLTKDDLKHISQFENMTAVGIDVGVKDSEPYHMILRFPPLRNPREVVSCKLHVESEYTGADNFARDRLYLVQERLKNAGINARRVA